MRHHTGSGRPGVGLDTPVWNRVGGTVVEGTLPARVLVGPPGEDPVWSPSERNVVTTPRDPVYQGPDGAEDEGGPGEVTADAPADRTEAAGELVPERTYTVRLARSWAGADVVVSGHVVTVVSDPDPSLVGARLHVQSVRHGSRDFTRHLTCTLIG